LKTRLASIAAWLSSATSTAVAPLRLRRHPSAGKVRIAAVVVSTMAIFLLRSPSVITHPAFLEEEIAGWWSATFARSPLETLATPWNGTLYVLLRAGFLLDRLLPISIAPMGGSILFILTLGLIAGFIASGRLAEAIPGDWVRAAIGVGLVLLPFRVVHEYATILDLPFWLAIYLTLLLVATPPTNRAWKAADLAGAAVAAFSATAALVLAPLYLLSIRRRPAVSLVVLSGAAVEAVTFLTSQRRPVDLDPAGVLVVAVSRMLTSPFGDNQGYKLFAHPVIAIAVMAVVAIAFVLAARKLPRVTVAVLVYASAAIAVLGTMGQANSPANLPNFTDQGRYFIISAWTLLAVGVAGLAAGVKSWKPVIPTFGGMGDLARLAARVGGLVLCLSLAYGLRSTARVDPIFGPQWACVGSNTACTAGSVYWPGDPAQFKVPVGTSTSGWVYPK
jgi:hypothetical protein